MQALKIKVITSFGSRSFGEVGAFLSHYKLWQRIAEKTSSHYKALILEDDVHFMPYFVQNLLSIAEYSKRTDWDLLYLGRQKPAPIGAKAVDHQYYNPAHCRKYEVVPVAECSWGSHAYLLTRAGASKLLEVGPLSKMLAADHLLNVMAGQCLHSTRSGVSLEKYFPVRNLKAFAAKPDLVLPLCVLFDLDCDRADNSDTQSDAKVFYGTQNQPSEHRQR